MFPSDHLAEIVRRSCRHYRHSQEANSDHSEREQHTRCITRQWFKSFCCFCRGVDVGLACFEERGRREFLSLLVAVIGTTLSAYLYTWQSNQEVERRDRDGQATIVRAKRGDQKGVKRNTN